MKWYCFHRSFLKRNKHGVPLKKLAYGEVSELRFAFMSSGNKTFSSLICPFTVDLEELINGEVEEEPL